MTCLYDITLHKKGDTECEDDLEKEKKINLPE